MSTTPWKQQVRKYNNETTFEQDPLNIPINDLIQRTDNLYERLNQVADKNAVIIESADADVIISGASTVYWDSENSYYSPAQAVWSDTYGPNGELQVAEAGMVQGLVLDVPVDRVANILLSGSVELTGSQMLSLFGVAAPVVGLYFASATTPGEITNVKPATPVPVLYYRGLNRITMAVGAPPEHNHIHKNYILVESWLDISNPIFDDMEKPVGAFRGYHKAADAYVDELFMSYPGDFTMTIDGVVSNDFVANNDNVWYMQDADPSSLGALNMYTTVPYNYGQPIVRAIETTGDDLSIQGVNGVVTINLNPWLPQTPTFSGTAVSYLDGRTVGITPVVTAIYAQGTGITVHPPTASGEVVIAVGESGLGNLYADVVNLDNAMQVSDGPFILLTFPVDRDSSMIGKIPCPQLDVPSGYHYEIKAFVERRGLGTSGSPISFPTIEVDLTYLLDAADGAVDIGAAATLSTTIEAEDTIQTEKYYTLAEDALSVTKPGTVYVSLSMDAGALNKSLFDFGVNIELIAD